MLSKIPQEWERRDRQGEDQGGWLNQVSSTASKCGAILLTEAMSAEQGRGGAKLWMTSVPMGSSRGKQGHPRTSAPAQMLNHWTSNSLQLSMQSRRAGSASSSPRWGGGSGGQGRHDGGTPPRDVNQMQQRDLDRAIGANLRPRLFDVDVLLGGREDSAGMDMPLDSWSARIARLPAHQAAGRRQTCFASSCT